MTRQQEFYRQIALGREALAKNKTSDSFTHFENAHILGQPNIYQHMLSHYYMFLFGLKTKNTKEIAGQIFRFFAAIVFTLTWIPKGNTGGSNVSSIQPMPIKKEFQKYF